MDQLKQLEQLANRAIALAEAADELRARNSRQIKKAGASILEAVERQRKETRDEIDARIAEDAARTAAAMAEVEALAKSHGLQVTVAKTPAKPKAKAKPKPKKVAPEAPVDTDIAGVDVIDLTRVPSGPKEIRAWAASNGFEVKPRGAIPAQVRAAYEANAEATVEATAS